MDLKCRKTDCKNNNCYSCECKDITIAKNTDCMCFEKGNEKNLQDVSKNMFETAPDIHPFRHIKDVKIKCDNCNCLFNDECRCKANGITVNSDDCNAYCATEIKK